MQLRHGVNNGALPDAVALKILPVAAPPAAPKPTPATKAARSLPVISLTCSVSLQVVGIPTEDLTA